MSGAVQARLGGQDAMNERKTDRPVAPAGEGQRAEGRLRTVAPAVDIYETKDGLVLLADLPGVSSDAVKIDVQKDVLTISARFTGEGAFPGEPTWSEITPREYYRAFALGDDLDSARIAAAMKNGVLELTLPKAERAKTKKIKVNAS
jgi:HSP20 family protein